MHSFKDAKGNNWTIDLNVGTIIRVQKEIGLNLRELVDGDDKNPLEPAYEFISDPMAFGPALLCLLEAKLKDKGVTPETFLENLDGASAAEAGIAFLRAYVDFFHSAKREAFHKQIDKALALTVKMSEMAARKLGEANFDEVVSKAEKAIDERLASLSKTPFGSAPAS